MVFNWPYVAGIFDGEGCVHVAVPNSFNLQITQHNPTFLVGLRDWLKGEGIYARLTSPHTGASPENLLISRRESICKFAVRALPFLNIKKAAVQDLRRFLTLYPDMRQITTYYREGALKAWETKRARAEA